MLAVGTMWCSTSAHSFCFTETMPIDLLALENQIEVSTPPGKSNPLYFYKISSDVFSVTLDFSSLSLLSFIFLGPSS